MESKMLTTRMIRYLILLWASVLPWGATQAQTYPTKTIQIISAVPTGSAADTALRLATSKMSEAMGQRFTIDIRMGASGVVAASAVNKTAPDGYTMVYTTPNILTVRYLYKDLPFDGLKDFAPVSIVVDIPSLFVVNASIPVNSMTEFIEYAKSNPAKLSYASVGTGSSYQLLGEALKLSTGIDMVHVPYSGPAIAQLTADLAGNRVQASFPSFTSIRPLLNSGNVKVLAIIDKNRIKQLPSVPTINETIPSYYNYTVWFGLLAPARIPPQIATRLSREIRTALQDAAVMAKLDELAVPVIANTPEEFATRLKADAVFLSDLVRQLGIKPE